MLGVGQLKLAQQPALVAVLARSRPPLAAIVPVCSQARYERALSGEINWPLARTSSIVVRHTWPAVSDPGRPSIR